MHAGRSEAAVAPAGILRGFGGTTEIVTEILGLGRGLTSPYMGRVLPVPGAISDGILGLAAGGLAVLGSGGLSRLLGWKRG